MQHTTPWDNPTYVRTYICMYPSVVRKQVQVQIQNNHFQQFLCIPTSLVEGWSSIIVEQNSNTHM